ncbi:efflux RND transporter permease subunit [Devosia sp. BK]|uniref:efflux RND transporter permease subunit n=1 Tax=Devosia sp. BK TaxID=2871706 RepID=UPI0039775C09
MPSRFLHRKIARPVFAIVLAIVTCLAGVVGIYSLPISQYPEIAPTTISIRATWCADGHLTCGHALE